MTKGKKIVAAVLTPLVLGGFFYAAQPSPSQAAEDNAGTPGQTAYGLRIGRNLGGLITSISEKLGLDLDTLRAERRSGKSLAEIASEQGVSEDELIDTITSERQKLIEEKVAEGIITREQADYCIERMEARVKQNIERKAVGPNGNGQGQGYRRGRGSGNGKAFQGRGMGRQQAGQMFRGSVFYRFGNVQQ
ncbi:MAG: hypothetical protein PWP31_1354 [Clostridia bacterium]|nr:hypothetical protein [Clostridia bacterium]MDK2901602.1 hypothetical protein [Thermosediminibacterales bacterium]